MSALDLLHAWDRARGRPGYRLGGVILGLTAAAGLLVAPRPAGMEASAQSAAALTVLMAIWWLGGVLPMAVTALVPIVALPLLGIASVREAAAPYADPLNVLMLGGFLLAHAMEEVGLHRRVVAALLAPASVRASPRRAAFALMIAAASVSAFVNNTAAMLMMLPIALGMAGRAAPGHARVRAAYILCAAYACSIGGVSTLVGTAPNAVLAGLAPRLAGRELGFVQWMCVGVPFVALALPTAWAVVTRWVLPLPPVAAPGSVASSLSGDDAADPGARPVLVVLAACFVAWLTRAPVTLGAWQFAGWGASMPAKVDDGFVAIAAALVLFVLPRPSGSPARGALDAYGDDGDEGGFLLSWRRAARAVPWSVLVLMGGGFALADAIQTSGLSAWLAGPLARLGALPTVGQIFVIASGVAFLSAFTSNTATTQIALPLLGAGAAAAGADPLLWMSAATIAASCDFALAVGTPPNAIAAEAGDVSPADMLTAGLALNVLCAGVVTLVMLTAGAAFL